MEQTILLSGHNSDLRVSNRNTMNELARRKNKVKDNVNTQAKPFCCVICKQFRCMVFRTSGEKFLEVKAKLYTW